MILFVGALPFLESFKVLDFNNQIELYKIIVSQRANMFEKEAALFLKNFVVKISGANLNIIDDSKTKQPYEIVIGNTNRYVSQVFDKDQFLIESKDLSYFIQGGKKGIYYGVFQFFKELFNYNSELNTNSIKKSTKVYLSNRIANKNEKPDFDYRFMYYSKGFDKDYQFDNKLSSFGIDTETGKLSFEDCGSVVHNFLLLFGYDKHFSKHPDYYPLINGQRTKEGLQVNNAYKVPCLTNEGVYQIILSELKKRIQEVPNTKIWNLSLPDGINDSNDYCNCENCKKKYDLGNGLSEAVFPFINRLAYDLPNKIIRTLAYTVTSNPHTGISKLSNGKTLKKGELAKNVEILFTLPYNDKSKSIAFASDEKSILYRRNLASWAAITNNIFIWEYIVNFNYYLFPFPTLHTVKDNFEFFKKNNVKSIFIQSSSMEVSALAELNSYVYAQLMWNSKKELLPLINDFCKDFYGIASDEMTTYINSLLNYIKLNKGTIWNPLSGIGSLVYHANPDVNLENDTLFSLKHLKEYKKLLNTALNKTKGSFYYNRILKEYLCVLFVEIEASTYYANKFGGKFSLEFFNFVTNDGKVSFNKKFEEFLSLCNILKIDYISEGLRTPTSYINDVKVSMHLK